jgi:4-amino-4-deoxy-L-arabinose transferase-like glycosyltransferase
MLRTADPIAPAAPPWSPPERTPARPTVPGRWAALLADERPICDRLLVVADRYRLWLFAAVALFYAAAFNGQWRVQPDAALYLSIGRNLAQGHGYTYLGQPNQLAYPGWPVMIAAAFRLFGSASLVPVHLLMLAIAAGTLGAVYRLVLLRAGRPTAVVVTVGTALTKSFFVYALELWTDLPFAMAAVAALAGYEGVVGAGPNRRRRWYDWALLAGGLGLAMVTRPTGWVLLLAVALGLAVDAARGRVRWSTPAVVFGMMVALAVVLLARHASGGRYEQYLLARLSGSADPLNRSLREKVIGLFTHTASDVLFQTRLGDAGNSILSAVVLTLGFGLFLARPLWGLWFALLLATVLVAGQETLDRYFLPVLPLLVYAWWSALAWVDRRFAVGGRARRWTADWVFVVLLGFGAVANAGKVGGLIAQQRAQPFLALYEKGRYQPVPAMAAAIERRVGPDGLVLIKPPYGRVMAFLSQRTVTNAADANALLAPGRPVFVVEPTDKAVRDLLAQSGLVEGPELYAAPAAPAQSTMAEPLSLHATTHR